MNLIYGVIGTYALSFFRTVANIILGGSRALHILHEDFVSATIQDI